MKTFLGLFILALMFSCGKASDSPRKEVNREAITGPVYFSLMNEYRIKLGLKPLIYSEIIQEVALEHSTWMSVGKGPFGHDGWQDRCKRIRVELRGVRCGEIVARGQKTPERVLEAWLSSPPHRKSIEGPDWTHTGVGLARSPEGQLYWTQLFLKID